MCNDNIQCQYFLSKLAIYIPNIPIWIFLKSLGQQEKEEEAVYFDEDDIPWQVTKTVS